MDGAEIQVVNCSIKIDLRLKSILMRFFLFKFGIVVQPLRAACAAMQRLDAAGRFEPSRDLSAVLPIHFSTLSVVGAGVVDAVWTCSG